jgi:hypothetical protein
MVEDQGSLRIREVAARDGVAHPLSNRGNSELRHPDSQGASQSDDVTRETATKVSVEFHKCIAAGHCVLAAAEVFDQKRRRRRDRA